MTAPLPGFEASFRDDLDALFRWRRDVRHFLPRVLPEGLLDTLLQTANRAPSVGLSQPWRFVIVEDSARRTAIRADFLHCNADALAAQPGDRSATYARLKLAALDEAPCHLAVFVDPDPAQGHGLGRRTMPETIGYSAVIAIHTLWLAACAAGLGLGWVSILDPDRVRRALALPDDWRLVGYLCLGYPAYDADTPELEREGWDHRRPPSIVGR